MESHFSMGLCRAFTQIPRMYDLFKEVCVVQQVCLLTEMILGEFDKKWTHNKILPGACSKRKGDLWVDMLTHVIIIEIDEHQHIRKAYKQCHDRIYGIIQRCCAPPTGYA
jgi:hypothetical protein